MQRAIPCTLMRGGTSRGPFFLVRDLPCRQRNPRLLDAVLLRTLTPLVDSLGGGPSVTTKAALVERSPLPDVDIDLHFAQIDAERGIVDWTPLCGNMLSAVAPFALEKGLVSPSPSATQRSTDPTADTADGGTENATTTNVVVRNVGTGAVADVKVCTPEGRVTYEGNCVIAGVAGTGAPVHVNFRHISGSKTGKLLPTGNVLDILHTATGDEIPATCLDVATPIVFLPATAVGKTGYESPASLTADSALLQTLLHLRSQAQSLMSLSHLGPHSVLPKLVLVAPPRTSGHLTARYFTPWTAHGSFAVCGAICTAAAGMIEGGVVESVLRRDGRLWGEVEIEHAAGSITATLDGEILKGGGIVVRGGRCVRTVRKIMDGYVYVPEGVWREFREG